MNREDRAVLRRGHRSVEIKLKVFDLMVEDVLNLNFPVQGGIMGRSLRPDFLGAKVYG